MRALGLVLVVVSIVLVFVALHFVRGPGGSAPDTTAATGPQIVVAAAAMNFGDHLTAAKLRQVRWPSDALPPGSFTTVDEIVGNGQDRVALQTIEPGEPILAAKITANGGRASLSSIIDAGMRAVTLRVNDATGVAGFILPSDRVDVLITRTPSVEGKQEQPQTEILLQNVKVLGVDQEANEKKDNDKPTAIVAKAVTLEVSPEDAEKLTLGQQIGALSLALRNFSSKQVVDIRPFSGANLRPTDPPKVDLVPTPVPAPDRAPINVTILRGASATAVQVGR